MMEALGTPTFPVEDHDLYTTNNEQVTSEPGLELGAEVYGGQEGSLPESVEIIDDVPEKDSRNHHCGPIAERRISEKRARQKAFSKRLATFKKQARFLHTNCAAKVNFTVVAESGKVTQMSYPPLSYLSVKLQAGSTELEAMKRKNLRKKLNDKTHGTAGTPKKKPLTIINNLPGNRKQSVPARAERIDNKCSICSVIFNSNKDTVIFNSNKDKELKKKFKLQNTLIGCDQCTFWAHVRCVKIVLKSRKDIASLNFVCNNH